MNYNISLSTVLIIISTSLLIGITLYFLFRSLKQKRYNEEKQMIILEEVRNSFEKQIYALNDRLIQNEERWRDVNHLLIDNKSQSITNSTDKKIYFSEFLKANGIRENDLNINERLVFILTPLHEKFYDEYLIMREACTNLGFTCYRGDEKQFKGDIFPEMLRYIVQSKIIIANINGRSPNVLYELGIAQALDKNVILVSKEPDDIPVDIKSQRFVIYSDSNSLYNKLQNEIKKLI